ncbi:hypothetical protein F4604DRAFT_1191253 [Suillus subluteus]|nr:hypothetical protein F4604DRAFT_1191253 [Suillus subluteus]
MFYRILATSRWRLWPIMRFCLFPPSPHCPHHDPSPILHLLHSPMPDIPHISNMTFKAQMYWQNFDDDTPLSSISLHVCSRIETLLRNRFCVKIRHYCFVLLLLALAWLVLYEAATLAFPRTLPIHSSAVWSHAFMFFSHSWMHSYTSIVTGNLHLATKSIATHTPHLFTRVAVA